MTMRKLKISYTEFKNVQLLLKNDNWASYKVELLSEKYLIKKNSSCFTDVDNLYTHMTNDLYVEYTYTHMCKKVKSLIHRGGVIILHSMISHQTLICHFPFSVFVFRGTFYLPSTRPSKSPTKPKAPPNLGGF